MFTSTKPSRFAETCATDHVRYLGTTVESKEQDLAHSEHPKARRFRVRRWVENQQGRNDEDSEWEMTTTLAFICAMGKRRQ
jgi:hypothetical protein